MPNIEKALEKFKQLPIEAVLTIDSNDVYNEVKKLNDKYGVNLSPLIVFISVNELDYNSAENYLVNDLGVDSGKSKEIFDQVKNNVLDPVVRRLAFLDANAHKTSITTKEIKEILIDIFESGFVHESKSDPVILSAINLQILYILRDELTFQNELARAMYDNQELLTEKDFVYDGKPSAATISHWLKDFIQKNGSGMFDSIVLTKYITESENTKKLSDKERAVVKKMLQTYRNIKFFPNSMYSDRVEDWEIFPVNDEEHQVGISGNKSKEELIIDDLREGQKQYSKGSLESEVIEEEISREREIEGLKIILKKYKKGTLEYSAIQEEIEKREVE